LATKLHGGGRRSAVSQKATSGTRTSSKRWRPAVGNVRLPRDGRGVHRL
jgi:hypothetical protein